MDTRQKDTTVLLAAAIEEHRLSRDQIKRFGHSAPTAWHHIGRRDGFIDSLLILTHGTTHTPAAREDRTEIIQHIEQTVIEGG